MNPHNRIGVALFAFGAFLPLTFPSGHAQERQQQSAITVGTPRIDGFDVMPVKQLAAGNELAFTLYGSPGGTASVQVGGAAGSLILAEVEAGVYEGSYTISKRDRITAQSTATANLRLGNRVATSVLDDALVAGAPAPWPGGSSAAKGQPRIDSFEVDPAARLMPGAELLFTLSGSPDGSASIRINGVNGKLALEEVTPGVYEGTYTIKNRDRIAVNTVVTGNLRLGKLEHSRVLGRALAQLSPAPRRTRPERPRSAAAVPACASCGVVEAVNVVEVKGNGSYLGKIGGGVVGALIGGEVGHGSTIAAVVGAAGGAFAGNEIEKKMRTTKHYEVLVRLENGGSQTVSYATQPVFGVGSRVKVENGALVQI